MKILLLEDNVSLAEIIKEVFEEKGFTLDWFVDGQEALYSIVDGYDCFILDIHVPRSVSYTHLTLPTKRIV